MKIGKVALLSTFAACGSMAMQMRSPSGELVASHDDVEGSVEKVHDDDVVVDDAEDVTVDDSVDVEDESEDTSAHFSARKAMETEFCESSTANGRCDVCVDLLTAYHHGKTHEADHLCSFKLPGSSDRSRCKKMKKTWEKFAGEGTPQNGLTRGDGAEIAGHGARAECGSEEAQAIDARLQCEDMGCCAQTCNPFLEHSQVAAAERAAAEAQRAEEEAQRAAEAEAHAAAVAAAEEAFEAAKEDLCVHLGVDAPSTDLPAFTGVAPKAVQPPKAAPTFRSERKAADAACNGANGKFTSKVSVCLDAVKAKFSPFASAAQNALDICTEFRNHHKNPFHNAETGDKLNACKKAMTAALKPYEAAHAKATEAHSGDVEAYKAYNSALIAHNQAADAHKAAKDAKVKAALDHAKTRWNFSVTAQDAAAALEELTGEAPSVPETAADCAPEVEEGEMEEVESEVDSDDEY